MRVCVFLSTSVCLCVCCAANQQSTCSGSTSCATESSPDTGYAGTPSADSDRTAAGPAGPSPCPDSSKDYFRRSGKAVWRASMALHRTSNHKDSGVVDSADHAANSERSTAEKSRRLERPRKPTADCTHEQHLHGTSHDNDVRPITFHTTDRNRQHGKEIDAEERQVTAAEKDASKLDLRRTERRTDDQTCVHELRAVQRSTLRSQSAAAFDDSSLTDLAALDDLSQLQPDNTVDTGATAAADRQPADEAAERNRSEKTCQHGSEQKTHSPVNITRDDNGRAATERCDLCTSSQAAVPSLGPCQPGCSSAVDAPLIVDVDSRLHADRDVLAKHTSSDAEVLRTADHATGTAVQLPDERHDRTRLALRQPTNGRSDNDRRETRGKNAPITATNGKSHRQDVINADMTSHVTSPETSRGDSSRPNTALLHPLPTRPAIASFIARILRWPS